MTIFATSCDPKHIRLSPSNWPSIILLAFWAEFSADAYKENYRCNDDIQRSVPSGLSAVVWLWPPYCQLPPSRSRRRAYLKFTISSIAGNGNAGFSGDGGPAISAEFDNPIGLALDSEGNIYIADPGNNRVREVTPSGIITTVAGNGQMAFSGDGGVATNAALNGPGRISTDAQGNLYIDDGGNNRIRKVVPVGTITTIAGNGEAGYSGDGGQATQAALNLPEASATDAAGNLYFADTYNNRIRKITTDGIITTVAGNGQPGYAGDGGAATSAFLNNPTGIALDALGNLLIADQANDVIRKVTNGIISTIAGNGNAGYSGDGGTATLAELSPPRP